MTKLHMALPFVVAVIRNSEGLILIGEHPDHPSKPYPCKIDLPGGKMKPSEVPEDCLVREVREETGFFVVTSRLIGAYHHDASHPDCTNRIHSLGLCYEVEVTGEFSPSEMNNMRFVSREELRELLDNMTPWAAFFIKDYLVEN